MRRKGQRLSCCMILLLGVYPSFSMNASGRGWAADRLLFSRRVSGVLSAEVTQNQPRSGETSETPRPALRWWGRVDGRDLLRIRRGQVWVVHEEGFPIVETGFRLERPLPTEPVTVTVRKIRGRGTVDVIEQPTRENNFTATIRIEDKKSGSDRYELEVFWEEARTERSATARGIGHGAWRNASQRISSC